MTPKTLLTSLLLTALLLSPAALAQSGDGMDDGMQEDDGMDDGMMEDDKDTPGAGPLVAGLAVLGVAAVALRRRRE